MYSLRVSWFCKLGVLACSDSLLCLLVVFSLLWSSYCIPNAQEFLSATIVGSVCGGGGKWHSDVMRVAYHASLFGYQRPGPASRWHDVALSRRCHHDDESAGPLISRLLPLSSCLGCYEEDMILSPFDFPLPSLSYLSPFLAPLSSLSSSLLSGWSRGQRRFKREQSCSRGLMMLVYRNIDWSRAVVINLFKPKIPDLSLGKGKIYLLKHWEKKHKKPRFYFQLEAFCLANCIC